MESSGRLTLRRGPIYQLVEHRRYLVGWAGGGALEGTTEDGGGVGELDEGVLWLSVLTLKSAARSKGIRTTALFPGSHMT